MEPSVRVVVANRPRLLRELVLATLSGQAGIEVVEKRKTSRTCLCWWRRRSRIFC